MIRLLASWLLSAIALLIVSRVVPGFHVDTLGTALIAALIFGLLNATLGLVLKIITFPITIITLGLFLLVINAMMIPVGLAPRSRFPCDRMDSGLPSRNSAHWHEGAFLSVQSFIQTVSC